MLIVLYSKFLASDPYYSFYLKKNIFSNSTIYKIAIVEPKVTIKLLLVCHYWDQNEYAHIPFGNIIS